MSVQPWEGTDISVSQLSPDELGGADPALNMRISVPLVLAADVPAGMPDTLTITTDWSMIARLKAGIAAIEASRFQFGTAAGRAAAQQEPEPEPEPEPTMEELAVEALRNPADPDLVMLVRLRRGLDKLDVVSTIGSAR